MVIRVLPALLLILFLPHLLEASEADYIGTIDTSLPPVTLHQALAFQSIALYVSADPDIAKEKLGNVSQSVIDTLKTILVSDDTYAQRLALMCPSNKSYFNPTEIAQAWAAHRALSKSGHIRAYQNWRNANPAIGSDMALWVWEETSKNSLNPVWTLNYATQDPVMLETWRQDVCGNAQLEAMGVFDAEDTEVTHLGTMP